MGGLAGIAGMQLLTTLQLQNQQASLTMALEQLEARNARENLVLATRKRIWETKQHVIADIFESSHKVADKWQKSLGGS